MIVKLNPAALRQAHWREYALRFVLGGLITALAGAISAAWGPVVGGLFLAFPAIYPATATLLDRHERARKQQAGIAFTIRGRLAAALEARGAIMGGLGTVAFAAIACRLLPRSGSAIALPAALACWLVGSTVLWYVRRRHPCVRAAIARRRR